MSKKLLIDARQSDETRVVLLNNNKLEDFDYETSHRKQLKGNIYLARVTRVEPSLQAAFVEYGGNRQGFLAFSEIHPDYYRIPVEDREKLLAEEAERVNTAEDGASDDGASDDSSAENETAEESATEGDDAPSTMAADANAEESISEAPDAENGDAENADEAKSNDASSDDDDDNADEEHDAREERRRHSRISRHYKIQEVISRRQILLIQVVKEERGNKGAALTTYLSLAGRYCVLMPNTYHGGGVSRKISNPADRKKLKTIVNGLDVPKGMAVIVRTAGSKRTKAEITRDFNYLSRQWDDIRSLTMDSTAPALIHEEGNLVKRSIRDYYGADVEEILVEGEEAYKSARAHMKNFMPTHIKKVKSYEDSSMSMFQRHQVETMLSAMHEPQVVLKSGGYLVINQTEALVAIDVNSGRATKERNIEETALKTNLEAAEEIAQQLRQRDLSGLVVIDFIDMENNRNQNSVERKLKDALRNDRARIQVGSISQFGLLEMSRQRLRPSLAESVTNTCPHCNGTGRVRSVESASLQVLRSIEAEALKEKSNAMTVFMNSEIALYILNHKHALLVELQERFGITITLEQDNSLITPEIRVGNNAPSQQRQNEGGRENNGRRRRGGGGGGNNKPQQDNNSQQDNDKSDHNKADGNTDGNADHPEASDEDEDKPRRRRRRGKRGGRRRGRREGQDDQNPQNDNAGHQADGENAENKPVQDNANTDHSAGDDKPKSSRRRKPKAAATGDQPEAVTSSETPTEAVTSDSGEAEKPAAKKAQKTAQKTAGKAAKKSAKTKAKTEKADDDGVKPVAKKAQKAAKKAKKAASKSAKKAKKSADTGEGNAVKDKTPSDKTQASSSPVKVVDVADVKPATKKKGWWS